MSNIYEKELRNEGIFNYELPESINKLVLAIPGDNVPYKMKVALAVSETVRYASQFKKNILIGNKSLIPINHITFCIAKSGIGKDSSIKAIQKCFKTSYEKIQEIRIEEAKQNAIQLAIEDGKQNSDSWSVYKNYLIAPNPLETGISTPEGLVQYLHEISSESIGSGYVYSGEFASELLSNINTIENIKILSEVYDEGTKNMKALKDKSKQTEITNVTANALFMSSQDTILYNDMVKVKFKNEFNTKLGRRSFFIFVNEELKKEETEDIYKIISENLEKEKKANEAITDFNADNIKLTMNLLKTIGEPIRITSEVEVLFELYKLYNDSEEAKISIQYPINKLSRKHAQWRALKIAGAFAIMDNSPKVEKKHFVHAIRYTEMISEDIKDFEKELVKEPYEVFCTYMKESTIDEESSISLHLLRKLGYIPMRGSPNNKMAELVQLANSYDDDGTYSVKNDCIHYNKITKTEEINITYLEVHGTKKERVSRCSNGFTSEKYYFKNLNNLLKKDYAYSPFVFRNGQRGIDYIVGGCKWLVFDIDNSEITDEEAHFLLNDINHFIVRTSDPNNEFKFRILLELDANIDIPNSSWNSFLKIIAEDLGLNVDYLPKSQIFFSYSGSKDTILETLNAKPLEVKPYLDKLQTINITGLVNYKSMTKTKLTEMLDNPYITFEYAFKCNPGRRSINLIKAAHHARHLGADKDKIIELVTMINDSWVHPLDINRFNQTIIQQINRWKF